MARSKKQQEEISTLSIVNIIKGNRRLAREKAMQIVASYIVSKENIDVLFEHIFERAFKIEEDEPLLEKTLTIDERAELNKDITIIWRNSDINFAKQLVHYCIANIDDILEDVAKVCENWSIDRITPVDKAIILICATEFINFDNISINVSINEAVELAKIYASDKTPSFVNGVLNKLKDEYFVSGKINKIVD